MIWAILSQYWDKILIILGSFVGAYLIRDHAKKSTELKIHKIELERKEQQIDQQIRHIQSIEQESKRSSERMEFMESLLRRKPAEDYTSEELNRLYNHPLDSFEPTDPGKKK